MSLARKTQSISVSDYLDLERDSNVKHEYLAGSIYAMAGATNQHNLIASNALGVLHARLRGSPCRVYNSDTKIRLRLPTHTRFYYPDLSVICRPNPPADTFQDEPVLVLEVLSEGTRRTDEGEKKDAYLALPSLHYYLLVDPDEKAVALYRRTEQGFVQEHYAQGRIVMAELGIALEVEELYEGYEEAH